MSAKEGLSSIAKLTLVHPSFVSRRSAKTPPVPKYLPANLEWVLILIVLARYSCILTVSKSLLNKIS